MSAVVAAGAPPAHSLSNNNSIKTPNDPSKSTHKSDAGHNSDRKAQQLKLPQTYSAPMNMTPVTVVSVSARCNFANDIFMHIADGCRTADAAHSIVGARDQSLSRNCRHLRGYSASHFCRWFSTRCKSLAIHFVFDKHAQTLENDLRELFEKHGQVREVKVIRDTESGVSKG
jgi:hypothetical protein